MESPENIDIQLPIIKRTSENSLFARTKRKVSDTLERFLERLAGSDDNWDNCESVLVTPSLFSIILFFNQFASAFIYNNIYAEMSESERTRAGLTKLFAPFMILMMTKLFLWLPNKYEYRCHFTDIRMPGITCLGLYLVITAWIVTVAASVEISICDIIALICLLLIFISIILGLFMNAQKCTKLRFQPTQENNSYNLLRSFCRKKDPIEILESGVFKITLRNRSSEPWNSKGFKLHRHAGRCHVLALSEEERRPPRSGNLDSDPPSIGEKDGHCARFRLPDFTIQPWHVVQLVPETAEFEEGANEVYIRIPKFHCFGLCERHNMIKTYISVPKMRWDDEREDKLCEYEKKIAERVVIYCKKPNE